MFYIFIKFRSRLMINIIDFRVKIWLQNSPHLYKYKLSIFILPDYALKWEYIPKF